MAETDGSNAVTLYRTPGVGYVKGGVQYFEQENALGSVLAVRTAVDAASVVGSTEYDAYGKETRTSGTERSSQRFAGQRGYQNDDATGMQLLGARYYLPAIGRFLTPDPIGQEGGLNLYAYCGDSPLMRTDAGGEDWRTIANFAAGLGDHIASSVYAMTMPGLIPQMFFGDASPTQKFRQIAGYDGNVDYGSGAYSSGNLAGWGWDIGTLVAGGLRAGPPRLMGVDEVFGGGQRSADLLFKGGFARNYAIDARDFAAQGFREEALRRGSQQGTGLVLRQYNAEGKMTGRVLQFHPGGGVHRAPYVKITSAAGGTVKGYGAGYRP